MSQFLSQLKECIMAKAKQAVAVAAQTEVKTEVKPLRIGQMIINQILEQPELSNEQILKNVLAQFEAAKTTMACIAWYKSKLRKEGRIGARTYPKKVKAEQPKAE
jgi:hypothetical protein